MFFSRPDLDLATAAVGFFTLALTLAMRDRLERDYKNMEGMIFGAVRNFDESCRQSSILSAS